LLCATVADFTRCADSRAPLDDGRATSALFFVRRGRACILFPLDTMRGAERREAQPKSSVLAKHGGVSCDRDATPHGAPLAAFLADVIRRNSGPRFFGVAACAAVPR
jgi:hypothetical protein